MRTPRQRLLLDPVGEDPEVGRWLAALEDGRRDTLHELEGVTHAMLDARPDPRLDSIGTLLYHVGLIEADWVASDILELDEPPALMALLPWPDRDAHGALTVVAGIPLAEHLERLAGIRAWVLDRLGGMSATDFHRVRSRPDHDVAPDWAIHHILQHEAEHRAHIAWVRDAG